MNLVESEKEAKSKNTLAARLEELARQPDTSIQLAVAKNPSANAATLECLPVRRKLKVPETRTRNSSTPVPFCSGCSSKATCRPTTPRQRTPTCPSYRHKLAQLQHLFTVKETL